LFVVGSRKKGWLDREHFDTKCMMDKAFPKIAQHRYPLSLQEVNLLIPQARMVFFLHLWAILSFTKKKPGLGS